MATFKKNTLDQLSTLSKQHDFFHVVVAAKSDTYPAAHFRCALLCALGASMLLYFVPWDFYDPIWYLYLQVPALLVGYFFAHFTPIKRLFTTSGEQKEEVYQMALETYHRINPASPRHQLLYLSLLEKRAELIGLQEQDEQALKKKRQGMKSLMKSLKGARANDLPVILEQHLDAFIDGSTLPVSRPVSAPEQDALAETDSATD